MKKLIVAIVLGVVSLTAHAEEEFASVIKCRIALGLDEKSAVGKDVCALPASNAEAKPTDYAALQEQLDNERLVIAPGHLQKLPTIDLCEAYGNAVRGEFINQLGASDPIRKLVKAEAKRRGLRFNDKLVKAEEITLRMNECTLVAAWGKPISKNTAVNSRRVLVQHVYGDFGPYVYTVNGTVDSWQN